MTGSAFQASNKSMLISVAVNGDVFLLPVCRSLCFVLKPLKWFSYLHSDLLCIHASDMLNIPTALRCLFYLKCYSGFTGTEHSTMCDCIVFTSLRKLWNEQYYTIIELTVK